jgi:hypothetical protein
MHLIVDAMATGSNVDRGAYSIEAADTFRLAEFVHRIYSWQP